MPPPTVCRHPVSGSISLPSSGCFSPFPHGTCSLSVMHEYLGLESGLPMFRQDFTCPALLKDNECSTCTGLSPATAGLSIPFHFIPHCHWPGPRSLATTCGVSVDVLSYRYLDVSVPCVRFLHLCIQCKIPYNNAWKTLMSSRAMRSGPGAASAATASRPCEACASSDRFRHKRFPKHLRWVSPFGDPWIKAYSQLPTAYRSVSRPSSPVHAKASTKCPYDT